MVLITSLLITGPFHFFMLTLSNVQPINQCTDVAVWLLISCWYSNLISLIYSDYWLSLPLSSERIKPGMSKRPLSASTPDNLLQPDTVHLTGHNPPALSSHPTPTTNNHYHSCVKWHTGQENCTMLMSQMWIIHVAVIQLLQNVMLLIHQIDFSIKVNGKCINHSLRCNTFFIINLIYHRSKYIFTHRVILENM